jgi:LysR family transcriptional regulator for bpeEF and oprC
VGVGSVLANLILIPRLSEFTRRYPDIELFLGVSDRSADIVSEGIDCVIRGGELADSTMKAKKLCELEYVVRATPSYFLERPTPHIRTIRPTGRPATGKPNERSPNPPIAA